MSVQSSRASVAKAVKDLQVLWLTTRGSWDDQVADEFEKRYLETIAHDFKSASSAMDHIGTLIAQMRRDCSE
ncbi:hypothetical protein BH10PLA1_BH10PLA1_00230 [soil metagenome]